MNQDMNLTTFTVTIDIDSAKMMIAGILGFLENFMPHTFAMRLIVFTLFLAGIPRAVISDITGCPRSTAYHYRRIIFSLKHPDEIKNHLVMKSGNGRPSKIADLTDQIVSFIEENTFRTLKEIASKIKEKFGVSIHVTNLNIFLKRNGIRRLKAASLPAKANPKLQRDFYDGTLHPLMEKAKAGEIQLLFMDAAHFVHGSDFLGYVYSKTRRLTKTFSGRKRHNILGALDFVTKKVITVTNDSYINAESVCDILRTIAAQAKPEVPVCIILDNARYQKCQLVTDLATKLGINLIYLPSYSPNLNLIERVWKFVKSGIRNVYYSDFESFKEAIDSIVSDTHTKYKAEMESLIGEKVQLYDDLVQAECA